MIIIKGHGASLSAQLHINPFLTEIFGDQMFEPKSFALVYAHNLTHSENRFVSVGQRQLGDQLLKHESKLVKMATSFPEYVIEYEDDNHYLTHVHFSFDVSVYYSVYKPSLVSSRNLNALLLFLWFCNNFSRRPLLHF